jgi:hypothetical protein
MSGDLKRFSNIGFEDFRRLARDPALSKYEKIGFPDSYRSGKEELIFEDICRKLTALDDEKKIVLDIGPGVSDLPVMLIEKISSRRGSLILVDSAEMLEQLPDNPCVEKFPAFYPDCPELVERLTGKVDAILCYSVLHYVFVDTSIFRFLDTSLSLLAPGGQMLIGDIPNVSKRKRFFSSEAGARFHQDFMGADEPPNVRFNKIESGQIDDAVIMSLIQRARSQGFDAYTLPQDPRLPMANRREDILIIRP